VEENGGKWRISNLSFLPHKTLNNYKNNLKFLYVSRARKYKFG
jgi:hypothetical protein